MTADADAQVRLTVEGRVARASIDRPPLNLLDKSLLSQFEAAFGDAETKADVLLVESAVPGFFAAHYDLEELLAEDVTSLRTSMGDFNRLMERIRTSRLVTIAKVRGAARGGGCELLLAFDMRFASRQLAVFSQPEAVLGIIAAGGGTQRLPDFVGRARALEMLLAGDDIDADIAERYGLVNRALPDQLLDGFVDALLDRLASVPATALGMAKLAVDAAVGRWSAGYALEALELDSLRRDEATRERMQQFLDQGGQSRAAELDFQRTIGLAFSESIPYCGERRGLTEGEEPK